MKEEYWQHLQQNSGKADMGMLSAFTHYVLNSAIEFATDEAEDDNHLPMAFGVGVFTLVLDMAMRHPEYLRALYVRADAEAHFTEHDLVDEFVRRMPLT